MSTDLAKLQVDMEKILHNAQEKELKSFEMFYTSIAKDITLESYDEHGVLKRYKIPNNAKNIATLKKILEAGYSPKKPNPKIRMGSDTEDGKNFDGITYDDGTNTFKFFADADIKTKTPILEFNDSILKFKGKNILKEGDVAGSAGKWVEKFSGHSTQIINRWGDGKYLLYMDLSGYNLAFVLEVSEGKAMNFIQSNAYFHGNYVYTAKYDGQVDKFGVIRWKGFTPSGAALQTVKKIYKWE